MRKILCLVSFICLFSCAEKQETEVVEVQYERSFGDSLENSSKRTVELLPEARQIVGEWLAYATAQNEIREMENRTITEIMDSSNNIAQIMENLQTTLPDTLKTNAVQSRVNVLYTKAMVLHQLSINKQKNPDEIFEIANDLTVEFDNFKLQLNELFLKTPENFEMELDEEFEESLEPDSTGTIPLFRQGRI